MPEAENAARYWLASCEMLRKRPGHACWEQAIEESLDFA
jgi:hypothetical protein